MDAPSGGDRDALGIGPEAGFTHPELMLPRGDGDEPYAQVEVFAVQGHFGRGGFHVEPDQAIPDGIGRGGGNLRRRAPGGDEPAQE
jgi:hypothetical protein